MSRSRDRISFQAIAIILSLAIACYGYIFSTPESAVAAGLSPEEAALNETGQVANSDGTGGENSAFPSDVDPLAFMVLDVQLTGEDSISLSWSDLGSDFVYTVEYCDSLAEGSWSPCPPVEQWPTGVTSWTDTSVTGSGTRFYRIHTEALSNPPSAPEDVAASVSGGNLVLSWGEVGGASSYNIYWSTDDKFTPLDANKIEDVRSPYSHSGLTFGTTYYYVVTAVGNMGESEVSSVASGALIPPLDGTVASTLSATSAFLYTGDSPIQTGMDPATIEPKRVAVLQGEVLNRDGEALSEVTISLLDHPEFGQTLSRDDGMFDMAVNGGGQLTIDYSKEGYLGAQRQVGVPWQDYALLPDVVLIPRDAEVTTVDLEAGSMQVARGSVMADDDGTRQATLLFPPGTTAELEFPDGGTQPITALSVRATEFTMGDSGPDAMPAELPPTVGYTYCVKFSVDEAEAAGAKSVLFDSALPVHVENFLDFPVGGAVPVGYYDADRGVWVPSDNGRIVEILSVEGGLAQLDVDGSGQPADATALADLGITDAEREQLASLYTPGQSLWRFPVTHFTPWDCNWPYGPPGDARAPSFPNSLLTSFKELLCKTTGLCELLGSSTIGIQNQTLGESVAITGTAFGLHYQSDRAPGHAVSYTLPIPLSGPTIPASLKRIDVEIQVGGRRFEQSFAAEPDQTYEFTWDGLDAYGRALQGQWPATIRVGYVYDAVYQEPAQVRRSFGALSGVPLTGSLARQELTLWQEHRARIGTWDARGQGLGGWTVGVHNAYDPVGQVLYSGDGSRRSARSVNSIITTVGDRTFAGPGGLAVAPDGSLYIEGAIRYRICRLETDGTLTTVAGNGKWGYSGDGGPATEASIAPGPDIDLGPDESLYIPDAGNNRVRRVDPDGIINTVAGDGTRGYGGDGGPATEAQITCAGVAVVADGSLYIADISNHRIRRVGPDGIITTIAGTGERGYSGDGGPAIEAQLYDPGNVALGPDGSLYIADRYNYRIRKVKPDGIITTIAGNGEEGFSGDGGPATEASISQPGGLAFGPDGSLYFADSFNDRVRKVSLDGIVTTVAGNGIRGYSGDEGPATKAQLWIPTDVAMGQDGALYLSCENDGHVRKVSRPLPGFDNTDIAISSEDGGALYHFDPYGRHLRTVNTLTGTTIYEFTYDDDGLLTEVKDGDGNITRIERDAEGTSTAIVAPFGQRTALNVNGDGYIDAITDPAGNSYRFTHANDGLLESVTNPRNYTSSYTYDEEGRLIKDEDPVGGYTELVRTEGNDSYTVSLNTAEGRTSSYQVEMLPTGESRRVNTSDCCTQNEVLFGTDGSTVVSYSDGTATAEVEGPDPRFGMQASVTEGTVSVTPGGVTFQLTREREAALTDPDDPLSVETLNETIEINGRTHSSAYDAATRTWTGTSPAGRQTKTTLDERGRVVEMQLGNLESAAFEYDYCGRVEHVTDGTRQSGLVYDATTGYLERASNPLGQTITYARDSLGRVSSLTLPDDTVWSYDRDEMGNLLVLTEPDGTTQHTFTYTPVNLIETYRSPLGAEEKFGYNKDERLIHREYPSGNVIDWVYNTKGQLTEIRTPEGNRTFVYDDVSGLLTQAISGDGQRVDYSYDASLLKSATWSSLIAGNISYTHNSDLRISQMEYCGITLDASYDNDGLLTGVGSISLSRDGENGLPTGISEGDFQVAYTHNSYGEMSSTTVTHGSDLYDVSYTYDALGRISQKVESIGGETHTWDYEYDSVGQLITVIRDGLGVESYAYDSVGNRIEMLNKLTGQNLTSDDFSHDADNKLLEAGATTYSYDPDGRLHQVTEGTSITTHHYNTDGTLAGVDLPDSRQIAYQHDDRGRRVTRSLDGVRTHAWLYGQSLMPLAEYDGDGSLRATFVYGASATPVTMIRDGSTYHIVSDHLGSPCLVVDDAGAIVKQVDYDAFGNVLSDSNPAFDIPFGFAGGMTDPDHELIRFGARDYQPSTGRWTAGDPILLFGGANLYAYGGNNPMNFVDRAGLQDEQSGCIKLTPLNFIRILHAVSVDVLTEAIYPYVTSEKDRRILEEAKRREVKARAELALAVMKMIEDEDNPQWLTAMADAEFPAKSFKYPNTIGEPSHVTVTYLKEPLTDPVLLQRYRRKIKANNISPSLFDLIPGSNWSAAAVGNYFAGTEG